MSKKILFSDFDDTLYFKKKYLLSYDLEDTIRALNEWKAAGNLFCINSGRRLDSLTDQLEKTGLFSDYYLTSMGAEAHDSGGGCLFSHIMPHEEAVRIALWMEEELHASFSVSGTKGDLWRTEPKSRSALEGIGKITHFTMGYGSEANMKQFQEQLARMTVIPFHIEPNWNFGNCDVYPIYCGKDAAIRSLLTVLGMTERDAIVIGDSANDYSMIAAFNGYTVPTCFREIPPVARAIVPSVAALIRSNL